MLDRAALDVDQAGDADADGAVERARRSRRRSASNTRAAVRDDAVGAGLGRLADLRRGSRRRRRRATPSVLVAPMSRPTLRPACGVTASHPASRSSSVTAAAPGREQPRRADPSAGRRTPARPAPLDHDRSRPAGERASDGRTSGCRCASRTWTTSGAVGERRLAPGATTRSAGQAPRHVADRDVGGGVDADHPRAAPGRAARPSTVTDRAAPAASWRPRRGRTRSAGAGREHPVDRGRPPRPAALATAGRRGRRPRSRPGSRGPARRRLSGAEAEQVGAGGEGQHGRLRDAAAGEAPAMSSASLTMTPSKPSRSRSRPRTGGLRVAGQRRGRARARRCARSSPPRCRPRRRPRTAPARGRPGSPASTSTHRQREVAVLGGVAVAREVLGAGGDAGRLQPVGPGGDVGGDQAPGRRRSCGCR